MKPGKKYSPEVPLVTETYIKSTYLIHPSVKENLFYIALAEKTKQSDLVRKALEDLIRKRGLDPYTSPNYGLNKK